MSAATIRCHKCEVAPSTTAITNCTACHNRALVCDDCAATYSPHCRSTRDRLLRRFRSEELQGTAFDADREVAP